MDISLSRDEVKELLQLVCIGSYVRNAVFETEDVYTPETDDRLVQELCALAYEEGIEEVEEDFDGEIGFSPLFQLMCWTLIEQYEEERFWEELENRTHVRHLEREDVCDC